MIEKKSLKSKKILLGINIDHVATLREARGGIFPSVFEAAMESIRAGADGITVHLREDMRHIQDDDVNELRKKISVPLNLEMSVSEPMVKIACCVKPEKACLVPERREELTTEGGLNVMKERKRIREVVKRLKNAGVLVSLFIDPIPKQIDAAHETETDFVELHTGSYANTCGSAKKRELGRLRAASRRLHEFGIGVNAGHGLDYKNVELVARLPYLQELNIGHSIISRAVFVGLFNAVKEMKKIIREAYS